MNLLHGYYYTLSWEKQLIRNILTCTHIKKTLYFLFFWVMVILVSSCKKDHFLQSNATYPVSAGVTQN